MTDKSGSAAYVYDSRGHMIRETRVISGVAQTIGYYYDGPGKLWTITYPSGRFIRYGYDATGRRNYIDLKRTASSPEEMIVSWAGYLPYGPLRGVNFGNGFTMWKQVDLEYRLSALQVSHNDTGAAFLENWTWWADDGMNLRAIADTVDTTKNQDFTYDDVGRLLTASGVYGARTYTYDKVGNRLTEVKTPPGGTAATQNYAYSASTNRLATVKQGTTTLRAFTHDAAGNIVADNRAGSVYNYTISAAGRISEVKLGTQLRASYRYDGKSRLAESVRVNMANAGTTRYLHDNNDRIIAEVNASGQVLREYVWLDDLPVAVLDGAANPSNPTVLWVHADHLNRPIAMTNATKSLVWRAHYEPFGAVHSITGPAANDNRFPGQMFQLESGLAYNWHRHYDATLGRYVSADPLGLQAMLSDGPSVYGYAGQSPEMNTDEDGQRFGPIGAKISEALSKVWKNTHFEGPNEKYSKSGEGRMCQILYKDKFIRLDFQEIKRGDDPIYHLNIGSSKPGKTNIHIPINPRRW